ncbi:hypothetical protein GQ55_3G469800 [Panicum hallii var. hallii]|uniref:Uncharacterized protein n=1 Tax=Panicum hallii var. hallii TaxID=1504633 RepID=A0A2T7EJ80_9POAL|nr:hypothetical protein GQ55_3G469800 [Panicum hallii var. hallii]
MSRSFLIQNGLVRMIKSWLKELVCFLSLWRTVKNLLSLENSLRNTHAKGGKCIVFTQTKRVADRLS